jgi:hypothetical protein
MPGAQRGAVSSVMNGLALCAACRYVLRELVDATLGAMAAAGGARGLAAIKRVVPAFDYYDPKD